YGPKLYVHVWHYLTDNELLSRIREFQSFDFHTSGAGQIIAMLLLGMIGGTLALTQKRPHQFAIAVVFTVLALRSARALPLAALALLPIANAAITESLRRSLRRPLVLGQGDAGESACATTLDSQFGEQGGAGIQPARLGPRAVDAAKAAPLLSALPEFLDYTDNLRALDRRFAGFALVPLVLIAAWKWMPPAGFPPDQFPVAAYSHIPAGARLFAPDKFGGYLIYRSNGQMKVFFDGRSDLYGADFLKQYSR